MFQDIIVQTVVVVLLVAGAAMMVGTVPCDVPLLFVRLLHTTFVQAVIVEDLVYFEVFCVFVQLETRMFGNGASCVALVGDTIKWQRDLATTLFR